MCSTTLLSCHHFSETADGLCSHAALLTEFTAFPLLSQSSPPPPAHLSLSLFLSSSLIPFRGKSILLGSGSKCCSTVSCLSQAVSLGGPEVVIKSRASCTSHCTQYLLGNETRFNLKMCCFLLQVLLPCAVSHS